MADSVFLLLVHFCERFALALKDWIPAFSGQSNFRIGR